MPSQPISADRLWDSMIAAKGGRPRLHAVRTLVFTASLPTPSSRQPRAEERQEYCFVFELPHRSWKWADYRPGRLGFGVNSFDLSTGKYWASQNGRVPEGVPVDRQLKLRFERDLEQLQLLYFLETSYLRPRVLGVSTGQDGTAMLDVQTPAVERVRYAVDLDTHLPRAATLTHVLASGARSEVAWSFDGVTDVDGLKMPRRVRGLGDVTFLINPRIDRRIFDQPMDAVTSGDACKQWVRE